MLGQWFHGIERAPSVEPPFKCHRIKSKSLKPLRRTGAGCFMLSGAVGDHQPAWWLRSRPFNHVIRQYTEAARQLRAIKVVA